MVAGGTPPATPTPTAPSRFITLCSPTSGEVMVSSPRGVFTSMWMPSMPDVNLRGKISEAPRMPKRRVSRDRPRTMPAPAGSSAFPTAARRGLLPPPPAGGLVGVPPRRAPRLLPRRQRLEQTPLGARVLLQRTVEVQVILGEVGEHRHVELGAGHAGERQRARGHFHRGAGDATVAHAREQRLKLHRLRRGLARVHRLIPH